MNNAESSTPLALALSRIEPMLNTAASWAIKAHLMSVDDRPLAPYLAARIAREPVIRDAISESCLEWIALRPLPKMDRETAVFLWERFEYANRFGQWLCKSGAECLGKSVDEVLQWLLIDSWTQVSILYWKNDLQAYF